MMLEAPDQMSGLPIVNCLPFLGHEKREGVHHLNMIDFMTADGDLLEPR